EPQNAEAVVVLASLGDEPGFEPPAQEPHRRPSARTEGASGRCDGGYFARDGKSGRGHRCLGRRARAGRAAEV
ncbi:MAG: hypothetical protein AVDCRST_MAG37-356, partial [uncultured Rubrobacteraceae bacterium]